jgi:hypothetical protein
MRKEISLELKPCKNMAASNNHLLPTYNDDEYDDHIDDIGCAQVALLKLIHKACLFRIDFNCSVRDVVDTKFDLLQTSMIKHWRSLPFWGGCELGTLATRKLQLGGRGSL